MPRRLAADLRDACVRIAVEAAEAIDIRFGSIDVVQADADSAALDKAFG